MLDRRRFLAVTAAGAASLRSLAQQPAQAPSATHTATHTATLKLNPGSPAAVVPKNFIGLSYETEQLADPSFFSPHNTGLIAQFKDLSPHGVLRLGGNTSDVGWWRPTSYTPQPTIHVHGNGNGEPTAALAYPIETAAITNLRAFLDATGWTCLYGINLGTNTPERAADEAAFVHQTLGSTQEGGKLEYFQLGNEPDLFGHHLRDPKTWNADAYFTEWLAEANAIRARIPFARFGLPDTAGDPTWYATVVDRLLALHADLCPCAQSPFAACSCYYGPNTPKDARPHIAALTHHYYFGGPPSNPNVNIDRLLQPNPKVLTLAHDIQAAASRLTANSPNPVPYRMTEGNTCYRGGKPGVSDVFASALWAADYLLLLASLGYAGVNLHGGDAKSVANSLGGKLPGDDLVLAAHGNPSAHPHPYYTPIAHIGDQYIAEPVAYGMKFAGHFAGATMIPVDFNPGIINATAYAAKLQDGGQIIAIINKDSQPFFWSGLDGWSPYETLSAPSLTSREALLKDSGKADAMMVPAHTAVIYHPIVL